MDRQILLESKDELYRACSILFGEDLDVSHDFLFYIQPSGIKSAYRRKAMETHPDVVAAKRAEEDGGPGAEQFIETNWAYNHLLEFIKRRDSGLRPFVSATNRTRPKKRPHRHAKAAQEDTYRAHRQRGNYYRGKLPSRKLLFGQFLFYSGEVSWEALIKAIVWQRNQRPRLGDIATRWNWLTEEEIKYALSNRQLGEPLGEALVRMNLLSRSQLIALLNKQQTLQKPFGEYFIKNNFITKAHMHQLSREFRRHNIKYFKSFNPYSRF